MADCIHGMPDPAWCSLCRHLPDPGTEDHQPKPAGGRWFPAEYPGKCSDCGDWYAPDTLIRADGEGGWLADCCDEQEATR